MLGLSDLLALAKKHFQSGDLPQAEQVCRDILRADPNNSDLFCRLGMTAHQAGRREIAAEYLQRAIGVNAGNPAYHYFLGAVYQSQGKTAEAEASFRQAIQLKPDYSEAHNDLGIALASQRRLVEAVKSFREAVRLRPDYGPSHKNLGSALLSMGKLEEGTACFQKAVALMPDNAPAHYLLANLLRDQGNHAAAATSYQQAIRLQPDFVDAHNNLGIALAVQGKLREAEQQYRHALRIKPDYWLAHNNLGSALRDQGRLDEALAVYRELLERKPDYPEAHNNLAITYAKMGRPDDAVASFREAVRLRPNYAEAHSNLGMALAEQGKLAEAVACYHEALRIKPDYHDALYNLGNALRTQNRFDEAIMCYEQAVRLKSDYVEAHNNLGIALGSLGRFEEAIQRYQHTLGIKPDYHEAHYNFGVALGQQGKLGESIARLEHALRVKPDYGEAHMSRAMAWLLQGKLDQGWQEYEWRWKCKNTKKPPFRQPLWDGSPLEGKAILLHVEQGLGDTIQFIRYAPVVKKLGGNVAVLCQRPLTRLLASCSSIDFLTCKPDEVPPVDLQAPLMSLPGIFRNTLQTIPADVPYLSADPGLVEHWRQKLGCPADPPHKPDAPARDTAGNPSLALRAGVGPFRIGIAWQGNPKYLGDRLRSIPLVKFAPLAQVEGVCLISLQKGPGADQVRAVQDHFRVVDLGPEVDEAAGPFMDTAAIITNLDLVITSDTAIPHLAGALGVPVWTALAYAPDWRFLLEREDSPWYPTMRLFRQKKLGDWDEVFDRIAQELANKLGTAYHRRDSVLSQLDAGSDLPTPTRTAREGSSLALGVSVAPKTPAASTVELIDTRRISIITPWRDHPELIEDYERAVAGAEVIIIDNASRPEHAQQLQAMVDRLRGVYLRNEENRGFAAANNQGMVRATGDILVFLNSDISASPGFLNMVLRDVKGDVLVGPSLHRQLVYGLWVPYLEGWCLAGRRGVWERLGGWDADAYPEPYWEDNDVCFRAVESGMQLVQARWPVQHKGGRTTTSVARWGESFERNRATFAARVRTLCERRREQKRADGEEEPVIVPSVHPQGPVAAKPFLNGQTLAERYHLACTCPSDINEHCTTLYALAQESRQITELGTRRGVSTTALLYAQPDKIACYDKWRYPQVDELQQLAGRTELVFHQADVLKVEIEPTDLLFIDTLHVYEQLRDELRLHADKARKYIVLHDTTTFADRGELEGSKGIWSAVEEFLAQRTFRLKQRHTHNNGLTVLERVLSATESGDGGSP